MMIRLKIKKLQYHINREAANISALSSGKVDKYEYLTGEEILPSNEKQVTEQPKFTYSSLGKAFKKQRKTIEDRGEKRIKALKDLKPKEQTKTIENKSDNKPIMNEEFYNRLFEERMGEIIN